MSRSPRSVIPFYWSEATTADFVLGPGHQREWKDRVKMLERSGLPQIDPVMGGRYGPAVKAFFDRRHGLTDKTIPTKADQPERWKTECQALPDKDPKTPKPPRPALSGAPAPTGNVSRIGSHPKPPAPEDTGLPPSSFPPTLPRSS